MPSNLVLALLISWRCGGESGPLHRAVAKPWGEAGSACVASVSICRQEGCCWHLLFGSSALLGVKHEQFGVFLQLWRPPSIRMCQSSEDICQARAVNPERVSGEARAPQQLVHRQQSVLLPPHHCPKSGLESNVILTHACPEKG